MRYKSFIKMESCFCNRLYHAKPSAKREYAFCGSLCRIREFETLDGLRYCLTVFSLSDYKQLHFPYDEYKIIVSKLNALLSPQAVIPTTEMNQSSLTIAQRPSDDDFKIKLGRYSLNIGIVTAFGLVNTSPFTDDITNPFFNGKKQFTCDSKWDICICRTCSVFSRLIKLEARALQLFDQHKPLNVIFSSDIE